MANYTGVVKWFDIEKGYGFISPNGADDVFVHHSHIKEEANNKDLYEGQEVTFDITQADRGPCAINVKKI